MNAEQKALVDIILTRNTSLADYIPYVEACNDYNFIVELVPFISYLIATCGGWNKSLTLNIPEIKELVKLLIEEHETLKIDLDAPDSTDWTPLHFAANWRQFDIFELLVENDADLFHKNSLGRTPVDDLPKGFRAIFKTIQSETE